MENRNDVRTDKTIAVQECAVVPIFMGAWIEINNNVMQRNIINRVVAPTEVRGLKCAILLQSIVA